MINIIMSWSTVNTPVRMSLNPLLHPHNHQCYKTVIIFNVIIIVMILDDLQIVTGEQLLIEDPIPSLEECTGILNLAKCIQFLATKVKVMLI